MLFYLNSRLLRTKHREERKNTRFVLFIYIYLSTTTTWLHYSATANTVASTIITAHEAAIESAIIIIRLPLRSFLL
jgi:hypothetical protein